MTVKVSERLKSLPPYLFVEIDKAKKKAKAEGRDIIDLGVGDPDTPTPEFIIEALREAVGEPSTHRYALDSGLPELKEAIGTWYEKRFGVSLDASSQILPLIGSKEGISHMPLAFVNPGDAALVPDPSYPPYKSGVIFAGGEVKLMPLRAENGFLPDLEDIADEDANRAKIMFMNYPNNPTGACCDKEYFGEVVRFAKAHDIIICHDAAYTELSFDGYMPPSFLNAEGALDVGVEFHSLSKTFNMTGWRIGFVVGNRDVVTAIGKVKSHIDSGIFTAIQKAGVAALSQYGSYINTLRSLYQRRRDVLCAGLEKIGWKTKKPKAAFYVWAECIKGYDSMKLARFLLEKADIVVTPGVGFGINGEGYVRMALTVGEDRLSEACERIRKII